MGRKRGGPRGWIVSCAARTQRESKRISEKARGVSSSVDLSTWLTAFKSLGVIRARV